MTGSCQCPRRDQPAIRPTLEHQGHAVHRQRQPRRLAPDIPRTGAHEELEETLPANPGDESLDLGDEIPTDYHMTDHLRWPSRESTSDGSPAYCSAAGKALIRSPATSAANRVLTKQPHCFPSVLDQHGYQPELLDRSSGEPDIARFGRRYENRPGGRP